MIVLALTISYNILPRSSMITYSSMSMVSNSPGMSTMNTSLLSCTSIYDVISTNSNATIGYVVLLCWYPYCFFCPSNHACPLKFLPHFSLSNISNSRTSSFYFSVVLATFMGAKLIFVCSWFSYFSTSASPTFLNLRSPPFTNIPPLHSLLSVSVFSHPLHSDSLVLLFSVFISAVQLVVQFGYYVHHLQVYLILLFFSCYNIHLRCYCLHVIYIALLESWLPLLYFQRAILCCQLPLLCFPCLIFICSTCCDVIFYCVQDFCFFKGSHSWYLVYSIVIRHLLFVIFCNVVCGEE